MHTPPFLLLLLFFTISGPYLVLSKEVDCSALNLANVRKIIPNEATQARQALHKIWKLSEKDVCRSTFQHLPISARSSRALGRRKSEGRMTMGEFLKHQVNEIKQDLERKIWGSWVSDLDLIGTKGTKDEIALRINQTIEQKLENMEHWNYEDNFQYLPEILISQFEEIVPNLDFLETFALNQEDMKEAIQGIACSWQPSDGSSIMDTDDVFGSDFETIMNTVGVENADLTSAKEVARNLMHDVLKNGITPLLNETMQKLRSLVYKLIPEFNEFHTFSLKLQAGKNIELENLLFKIPEKFDKVIEFLDKLLIQACNKRNFYLNESFESMWFTFIHYGRRSVNENNKIDLNKLLELFAENHTEEYIKTELKKLATLRDQLITDLEYGEYGSELLNLLVHIGNPEQQLEHRREWGQYDEMLNVRAEVLQAGAVQFLLDYFV